MGKEEEKKGKRKMAFIDRYVPKGAVTPLVWVVAYGVASGAVADLLHLPKEDRSSPFFFVPGKMLGTLTASTMTVIERKL